MLETVERARWTRRFATIGGILFAVLSGAAARAQAEPTADDKALATVLFQEGRSLMSAGRIADACPKLEESQRLDPSGGTLLNLALCHEQEGRLARSWSEFNDAAALARRDGRRDREVAAGDHALALAPRLSRLTVIVSSAAEVKGLRIERDGRELGRGAWSTAMPVDGGEHLVRATAPGKRSFTAGIVIGNESDAKNIEIPVLADDPTTVTISPVASSSSAPSIPADGGSPRGHVRQTVGWALSSAGLVQLGLAGYFGVRAFDKKCPDTNPECSTKDDALSSADTSTVLTITGMACVGVGVYLLLTSRHDPAPSVSSKVTLNVWQRGLTVGGQF
jgi:hypothetical protein